jgi:protein-S-isoprenylcysteine O-methyltransferase Ste14
MPSERPPVTALQLVGTGAFLLALPAGMLAVGGDVRWVRGWLFGAWYVALCATCIGWLRRKDPALLAERYRAPGTGGQSGWDRAVVVGLGLGFFAWLVVMPLDVRRCRWTPPSPLWATAAGAFLLALSFFFFFRSFVDNTYLSPLVRIQRERTQRVVSTGVYGFVRHPMYLGATLMFVGGSVFLGSACGLVVGLGLAALLVFRIVGEERLLATELEGYDQYRQRVRYRLVPGIW